MDATMSDSTTGDASGSTTSGGVGAGSGTGLSRHGHGPTTATTTTTKTGRAKMNYACEACRLAKVKCQPALADGGICKRCSEFKRECVFRTGPRTRRSKYSQAAAATPLPPPPGPGKTFSITFDMPAEQVPDSEFDQLREIHERTMSALYESDEELGPEFGDLGGNGPQGGSASATTFSFNEMSTQPPKRATTKSSSSFAAAASSRSGPHGDTTTHTNRTQPLGNLAIKPQFNLESATKLLDCFRGMLLQCPVVVLPPEADVRSMARESPFVLLAILAVTSCTTSLQGYSLYDEEFRKVLGLKFVAGGERSLELLQGLLIYCAWYPFHLRPKSKHGIQYLRMTVDIVRDLELDQEDGMQIPAEDKLASLRAFLGCVYLDTISSMAWFKAPAFKTEPWLTKCCAILEQSSSLYQDHVLVWLTRLQQISSEVYTQFCYQHKWTLQDNYQRELMRLGLVSRLREVQNNIPAKYSTAASIVLCSLFTDIYVVAGILMRAPRPSFKPSANAQEACSISSQDLLNATHAVRTFLDFVTGLASQEFATLSAGELCRIILVFTVAFRVSFPLPKVCPGLDYKRAREILRFDWYLEKLSQDPEDREENNKNNNNNNNNGAGRDMQHGKEDERQDSAGAKKNPSTNAQPKKNKIDVATALQVVIGSLRKTYARRIAAYDAAAAAAVAAASTSSVPDDMATNPGLDGTDNKRPACPMIDGSLENFIATWGGQQDQQYHSRYYQVTHPGTHADVQNARQYLFQQQQQSSPDVFPCVYVGPEWFQPTTATDPGTAAAETGTSSSSLSPFSSGYATSRSGGSSLISAAPLSTIAAGESATSVITSATTSGAEDGGQGGLAPGTVVFHDLWDAMTMGWTDGNMVDVVGVWQEESP